MKQHPLSAAFPSMPKEDLQSLLDDIQKHGQRDAVTIYEGMVLDGWNRVQCLESLGMEPRTEEFDPQGDPVAFVISRNLHRRHMDAGQRAVAVLSCHKWASEGRPKKLATGCPVSTKPLDSKALAKLAEVSVSTLKDAKTAIKAGKADEIRNGTASLRSIARPPRDPANRAESNGDKPHRDEQPAMAEALEDAQKEILAQEKLIESLRKTDKDGEILVWSKKYDALNGRLHQLLQTEAELRKTATWQTQLLTSIRKALGVESNREILPKLKELTA